MYHVDEVQVSTVTGIIWHSLLSHNIKTMALTQVGKVSAKAARAVRDGYAASMASVVSVFLLMCEYFIDVLLEK